MKIHPVNVAVLSALAAWKAAELFLGCGLTVPRADEVPHCQVHWLSEDVELEPGIPLSMRVVAFESVDGGPFRPVTIPRIESGASKCVH